MSNFKRHGHSNVMWRRWEVGGEWIRTRVKLCLRQLKFDLFSNSQANPVNDTHIHTWTHPFTALLRSHFGGALPVSLT